MALTAQEISNLKLWPHQLTGLKVVQRYLASAPSKSAPAALINVPTGGGKSAMIGAAIHGPAFQGPALVLTPRTSLRRQLTRDLAGTRGVLIGAPKQSLRIIREARSADELIAALANSDAIVSTIQLLHKVAKDAGLLKKIRAKIKTVYVDEGHYEPAPGWSRAIRALDRPTVLFTATPYRNDFRDFDLDPKAIHVTRYEDLKKARLLRELKIVEEQATTEATEFVRLAVDAFRRQFGTGPTAEKRLIIRCSSKENIEAVQRALANRPDGAIQSLGVHQRFAEPVNGVEANPPVFRHPPEPASRTEPVWVHQWKLMEGIDSQKFVAVATFQPFGSARALVQQVGRILRNPSGKKPDKALLIDFSAGQQGRQWERYLAFDENLTPKSLKEGLQEVSESFDIGAPRTVYADGEFRSKLLLASASATEIERSLRLPLRCSVLKTVLPDAIDLLKELTEQRFLESECAFSFFDLGDDVMVAIFARAGTSPYLADHYFVERSLNVIAALHLGQRLLITDTSRTGVNQDVLTEIGRPISRQELNRVLELTDSTVFTEVASRSMMIGGTGIRARSTQATSLEGSPPLLDDFLFAPTSLTAINRSRASSGRRELGFSTARVTDGAPLASYGMWKSWAADLIQKSTQANRVQPPYLDRFATPLGSAPARPDARSILIDAARMRERFEYQDPATGELSEVDIEDACFELSVKTVEKVKTRVFPKSAKANGVRLQGTVSFDPKRQRYEIDSAELRRFVPADPSVRLNLLDHLNSTQEFSVLTESPGIIYSEGAFFDPRIKLGPNFDSAALGLEGVFEVKPALQTVLTEKGPELSALPGGWSAGSVFEWIDTHAGDLVPNPQLVICDDGTRETCDFIIVGEDAAGHVVAMAHAKACRARNKTGASKLQEVCGQAVKQVGMLNSFDTLEPPQVQLWDGPWEGPSGEGTVDRRIRLANDRWAGLTGAQIWEKLSAILRDQRTRKQVALVLGASLNKQALYQAARRPVQRPHAVHTIHLLRSTISSVSAAGARLRIFCD